LTPAKAEEIARDELRKLVRDDSTWVVEEFMLRRFRGEAQGKWIYVVGFKPADGTTNATSDRFFLPISFSGEPAQITTR
jgi:fructose-1,6-bisphosphatase/inositol monophosphatase family enzyme